MGGVLYAFSSFVMAGLKRLPPDHGMTAMQSINVTAVRPGAPPAPQVATQPLCVSAEEASPRVWAIQGLRAVLWPARCAFDNTRFSMNRG